MHSKESPPTNPNGPPADAAILPSPPVATWKHHQELIIVGIILILCAWISGNKLGWWEHLGQQLHQQETYNTPEELQALRDQNMAHIAQMDEAAELLREQGDLDAALEKEFEALRQLKLIVGERHQLIPPMLDRMASIYYAKSNIEEAIAAERAALNIREVTLGPQHHDVILNLRSLADLLRITGEHALADTYERKATDIEKRTHPGLSEEPFELKAE